MHTKVIGTHLGLTPAFRLCFGGFNKGLKALFLHTLGTAEASGQRYELLGCLREFYPGTMSTVERVLTIYPRHAAQQMQKTSEVGGWLVHIGHQPDLTVAARDVVSRYSDLGIPVDRTWALEDLVEMYTAADSSSDEKSPAGLYGTRSRHSVSTPFLSKEERDTALLPTRRKCENTSLGTERKMTSDGTGSFQLK